MYIVMGECLLTPLRGARAQVTGPSLANQFFVRVVLYVVLRPLSWLCTRCSKSQSHILRVVPRSGQDLIGVDTRVEEKDRVN